MENETEMKNLQSVLSSIADGDIHTTNATKVEQKQARAIKAQTMNALLSLLKQLECNNITVSRTADGIAIGLDNEQAGFITIVVDATLKNLDYDIGYEAEDYEVNLKAKAELAEAKAKAKQSKNNNSKN